MTSVQIKEVLNRRPFDPFVVTMSSGERFEVTDPENAKMTKGSLLVFYRTVPDEEFPDRIAYCSYLHVASLDHLERSR